jgi:hypothetical protein
MEAVGHILSDEEYEEFLRLRDIVLANANDLGEIYLRGGQRVMSGDFLAHAVIDHTSSSFLWWFTERVFSLAFKQRMQQISFYFFSFSQC